MVHTLCSVCSPSVAVRPTASQGEWIDLHVGWGWPQGLPATSHAAAVVANSTQRLRIDTSAETLSECDDMCFCARPNASLIEYAKRCRKAIPPGAHCQVPKLAHGPAARRQNQCTDGASSPSAEPVCRARRPCQAETALSCSFLSRPRHRGYQ